MDIRSLWRHAEQMNRAIPAALFCCLCACDQLAPKAKNEPSPPPLTTPYQRFIPLPEVNSSVPGTHELYGGVPRPFLALDTMTGLLCRTWDFSWQKPTAEYQTNIQNLPTCNSLYVLSSVPSPASPPK